MRNGWIERVKTCGYKESIMWECQWENNCRADIEVRVHVDSFSLSVALNPRDALYGGHCETFARQETKWKPLEMVRTFTTDLVMKAIKSLWPRQAQHLPLEASRT